MDEREQTRSRLVLDSLVVATGCEHYGESEVAFHLSRPRNTLTATPES